MSYGVQVIHGMPLDIPGTLLDFPGIPRGAPRNRLGSRRQGHPQGSRTSFICIPGASRRAPGAYLGASDMPRDRPGALAGGFLVRLLAARDAFL